MLATGSYQLEYRGQRIGRENWDLLSAPGGSYQLNSYLSLKWPMPAYQQVAWRLDDRWITRTLDLSYDSAEKWQTAQASIVAEQWLMRRWSSSGQGDESRLTITPETHIDFNSPVFSLVVFRRLGIEAGAQSDVPMVSISLPDLAAEPLIQRFAGLDCEILRVPAGQFTVYRYAVTTPGSSDPPLMLWVTAQGVVVRQVSGDGDEVAELIHLER